MALTKSGELLRITRLKKGLSLEDVERDTKIRAKFLRALEGTKLESFHATPYARGFLKNYAEYLGLDPKFVLALFRRETDPQGVKIIPTGMIHQENAWFKITPTRALIFIAVIVVASIGYYPFQEYRGFLGTPTVSLEQPKEQQVVKEGEIEVIGKADIDTTVLVNGEPATVEETGKFKKTIQVIKGESTITVNAKNRRGKETTVIRTIKVE